LYVDSWRKDMDKQTRYWRGGRALLCLAVLLAVMGLQAPAGAAPSGVNTLGVVDFYAIAPLGSFEGSSPERFAADDLSELLTRAGADGLTVTPRGVVRRAEASIAWRNEDALRFDRLQTLARAAGADQLVIGWITMLNVDTGGSHDGGPPTADVSVVVQVFDATQGRIVAETRRSAFPLLFGTRTLLEEQSLHLVLMPTVSWLITAAGADAAGRGVPGPGDN
jgi:hypothetical protein